MTRLKKILSIALGVAMLVAFGVPAIGADSPSDWARDSVNAAIEQGLVPAAFQSSYTQAMTRIDFCIFAISVYESFAGEITERASFFDTDDENAQKAAYIGIMSGVDEGVFDPAAMLTREQAAVILSRLADVLGVSLESGAAVFTDIDGVSSWAVEAVGKVQAALIMGGVGDGRFAPQEPCTREQSIIAMARLYEFMAPGLSGSGEPEEPSEPEEPEEPEEPGGFPNMNDDLWNAQYIRVGYESDADYPLVAAVYSVEELDEYFSSDDDAVAMDDDSYAYPDSPFSITEAMEIYNSDFFAESFLVLLFFREGSGSIRHRVDSVSDDGSIVISRLLPEMGTADMAQWHIFIEIDVSLACDDFSVDVVDEIMS